MKTITIILLISILLVSITTASILPDWAKPQPTPESTITWEPVDKVWVYDHDETGVNSITFFVTYKSNTGIYEVREVNATTWYNAPPRRDVFGNCEMYFQGALS